MHSGKSAKESLMPTPVGDGHDGFAAFGLHQGGRFDREMKEIARFSGFGSHSALFACFYNQKRLQMARRKESHLLGSGIDQEKEKYL